MFQNKLTESLKYILYNGFTAFYKENTKSKTLQKWHEANTYIK